MEEEITISSLKNPSSRKNKPSSNNHKPPKRKSPDSSSSSQHRKSKSKKKEKKKTKHSCDCPEEFSDDLLPEDMPDEMTIDEWSKWLDLD